MRILLKDIDSPVNRPLTRVRSIFSLKNGIFSEIQRLKKKYPNAEYIYSHPNRQYEQLICKIEGYYPESSDINSLKDNNDYDIVIDSTELGVIKALNNIESSIYNDLYISGHDYVDTYGYDFIGDKRNLLISSKANVYKGVFFDLRDGVVVVDHEAEISPFSYISGPVYIGKGARIDCAKISGPTIIGNMCRIGGEVDNSIINDFSNKHHEGFVGHSIIGSWVNLGALTTTSDLKNNYGEIFLTIPDDFKPNTERLSKVSTDSIKFGSIIGDSVKTAIGTMINTGTVIDFGVNMFGGNPDKYTLPLKWGKETNFYRIERFIDDCEKIYKRRGQEVNKGIIDMISLII